MKFFKLLSVFALVALMGCEDQKKEEVVVETEAQDPDELVQDWNNAWNQNNYDSVASYLADDVVFLLQGKKYSAEEGQQWLRENTPITSDLETEADLKNSTDNIVYQAGTYSHGMKQNDSLTAQDSTRTDQKMASNDSLQKFKGTYTFIWEKDNSDDWKLKLINITEQEDSTAIQQ